MNQRVNFPSFLSVDFFIGLCHIVNACIVFYIDSGGTTMKRQLLLLLILIMTTSTLFGCTKPDGGVTVGDATPPETANQNIDTFGSKNDPVITMTMADGSEMKIQLFPKIAPNTVNNFISLAMNGYYDNLTFHRVISGFMIQGGDPEGTGMGGPGYEIKGEFLDNGVNNTLKHTRGVLSMARSMDYDTAGSQFFIMHADVKDLDGKYAAFGQVTSGFDVIDKIANAKKDGNDAPIEKIVIKKVTVELNGYAFEEPVVIKR